MNAEQLEQLWTTTLNELRLQMTKATFETWVQPTQGLRLDGRTLTISAPNGFARDWLDQRLRPIIERTLSSLLNDTISIQIEVLPPATTTPAMTTDADLMQQQLEIDGVRVTTYNEIVQPDRVFVGTQYFREKWLPLLGKTAWLLILELRQRCYYARSEKDLEERKKKSRDTCKLTLAELGAAIGVSESTARRALFPKDDETAALIGEFILDTKILRRYSNTQAREVNEATIWKVRLDDPLTPEDRKICSTCQNDS